MDWLVNMHIPDFSNPSIWVSLVTLIFLEIVLGVDNVIFISIVSNKLPEQQQRKARNIGLLFAMLFRIVLLLMINWIIGLKEPVTSLTWFAAINDGQPLDISWKDIILLIGGLFLIVKSTLEIHNKMKEVEQPHEHKVGTAVKKGIMGVIVQIILIDIIFSLDSILTAVGLVDDVLIMIIAVIFAVIVMMLFAGAISKVINKQPSLQMLALSFLVVIGVLLVAEGIHQHISKSIIYSCLAFSLVVEMLNIRLRSKQEKRKKIYNDDVIDNL